MQAKLEVSQPSDPLELEADQAADLVMRSLALPVEQVAPVPHALVASSPQLESPLQRACAECAAEQDEDATSPAIHRKTAAGAAPATTRSASPVEAALTRARAGAGERLPASIRNSMEPRFGMDLGAVRVHKDDASESVASRLGARAFTLGTDVFFGKDQFLPATTDGQRLIAHELAHVVQQSGPSPRLGVATKLLRQLMDEVCHETARWPGNFEHAAVESDYAVNVNPIGAALEFAIPGAGFADIVDLTTHAIYEIKTWNGAADGVVQAARYRDGAVVCDAAAPWHLGFLYPARVIPMTAEYEIVARQYPQFPGVIVYYKRYRRRQPVPEVVPVRAPAPAPAPERSALRQIADFVKRMLESADDVERAAEAFLREHPELVNFILGTAIGIVIGTIVEDVLTLGAGILDDIATIGIAYKLWRVARAASVAL